MDVAVAWAERMTSSRGGEDQAADDIRAYGGSEDDVRAVLGEEEAEQIEVCQDNAETVELFMNLQTQWNVGAMGGYLGLNYAAVAAVLQIGAHGPEQRAALFDGIRVMERAALPVLNRRND